MIDLDEYRGRLLGLEKDAMTGDRSAVLRVVSLERALLSLIEHALNGPSWGDSGLYANLEHGALEAIRNHIDDNT